MLWLIANKQLVNNQVGDPRLKQKLAQIFERAFCD